MEVIIVAISFIFSFSIFLVGIHKNSFILSLSGSLLLLLFSLVTIGMGIQSTEARTINLNISSSSGDEPYTFDVVSSGGVNDSYTFVFSLIMGVFSCFFLLYTMFYLRNQPIRE